MGKLTDRGEVVQAGYAALAVDGDDTLTMPEDATPAADSTAPEQETITPDDNTGGPAPVRETADDQSAADRETREN